MEETHAKFGKISVERFDDDHVVTQKRYRYYKSYIKRKKKIYNSWLNMAPKNLNVKLSFCGKWFKLIDI